MRTVIGFLALFCMAVAGALFAGNNESTITVFWPPHRIDLSLNLVILSLLTLFVLAHLALRALAALFAMPEEARRWRLQHRERAMHVALLDALSNLIAGRFIRARKAAELVLAQEHSLSHGDDASSHNPRLRVMAHLLVAESAHALQDKAVRDAHYAQALQQVSHRAAQEMGDGVALRAAHWALHDHDATQALQRLDALPSGTGRRTLALRLRLRAARMAQRTHLALETARLLAKHGAFSASVAQGVLRSQALELLAAAHDESQLAKAWSQLEVAERVMPDVALSAAERALQLDTDATQSRTCLLPIWERMLADPQALSAQQKTRLVQVLEAGFAKANGAPDSTWLSRIEMAQNNHPADAILQYLAGISCMHLQLWGKAQQHLTHSLPGLTDAALRRQAWVGLARLAEQRGDNVTTAQAWRNAAQA